MKEASGDALSRTADTGGSVMSAAQVIGLYTAVQAGAPMQSHSLVELIPGLGIAGDRYAARLGYWSDPRWPDQEVTLVEAEVAAELGIEPGQLRRNIVTQGVRLPDLIGAQFRIGNALLGGVRLCEPCRYLDGLTQPGLGHALRGRGGLRAHVVRGGTIRVGERLIRPAS